MSLTFAQMTTELQRLIDDTGSTSQTTIQRFLNMALVQVSRAHDWPELIKRDRATLLAPYDTGTVSISVGSATLTGVGSAWTTAGIAAGWRFATDYRAPFYDVLTVGDNTSITLADDWVLTALSGSAYKLWKPTISLPAAANKVKFAWLHDDDRRIPLARVNDDDMPDFWRYTDDEGTPTQYMHYERDSDGYLQIELGPCAPDKAYIVELLYRVDVDQSKLAADTGTTYTLEAERDELILQRALYLATRRDNKRAAAELAIYDAMLQDEISDTQEDDGSIFYLPEQRTAQTVRLGERWRDLQG